MNGWKPFAVIFAAIILLFLAAQGTLAAVHALLGPGTSQGLVELSSDYRDDYLPTIAEQLYHRLFAQPFNLIATVIFALAIVHTLLANSIHRYAIKMSKQAGMPHGGNAEEEFAVREPKKWFVIQLVYFLGEVEIIFGLWVVPLLILMSSQYSWEIAVNHLNSLDFTEPLFVIVIMTLASSYPVIRFAEKCLNSLVNLGKDSPATWWIVLLTIGPLLGSLITEPAAMTVTAMLLARKFYVYRPSPRLAYATIGILFTNISVGGVLTNFAAPPVLMVAKKWGWTTSYMMASFGLKAILGIVVVNIVYYLLLRGDFAKLKNVSHESHSGKHLSDVSIPSWITTVQLLFIAWAVFNNHYPVVFLMAFLLFLAFHKITLPYQSPLHLRSPLLVGTFLAGLVIHVSLQEWWIEPLLPHLTPLHLMSLAAGLTAFVDNAAITSLAALIPNFDDALKYAVVCGAVLGGGLTVIANAPNPAGQSILQSYFPGGVSPLWLFLAALPASLIMLAIFALL